MISKLNWQQSMSNADQPAFSQGPFKNALDRQKSEHLYGLTKREWFAGMAMRGILANPWLMQKFSDGTTSAAVQLKVKDFSEQQAEKMI